jgi:hypothetical protein
MRADALSSPVDRALLGSTSHLWSCGRQLRDASPIIGKIHQSVAAQRRDGQGCRTIFLTFINRWRRSHSSITGPINWR